MRRGVVHHPSSGAEAPLFYGWTIVAATFVLLFIGFGAAYSFAAFFTSLRDEFDASRGDVSLVFSITAAIYFALGALSGPLADRIGPRRVAYAGVACMTAGLLLASQAQALWQVYLTYSLGVGLGVGLLYVPAIGTVQRWFIVRRGMASGLAVTGIGVGTLVLPPLTAVLIDAASWRWAYASLGLLSLAAGLAAASVLEHSPARRGLHPDGERRLALSRGTPAAGLGTREAVTSRRFILLFAACFFTGVGLFIPFAHLAPYARDHGLGGSTGALLVGFIGGGSIVGRLALGGFADRLGRQRSVVGAFAGMGLALAWWLVAEDLWSLAIFAFVFGAAYGAYVALVPALTTDYFGGRNVGAIIGILYSGSAIGALIGPTLAGAIYDARGSYTLPIAFGVIVNGLAVACMLAIREPGPSTGESRGKGRVSEEAG